MPISRARPLIVLASTITLCACEQAQGEGAPSLAQAAPVTAQSAIQGGIAPPRTVLSLPETESLVSFPSEELAFMLGPQIRSGSADIPWRWFDENAVTKGREFGRAFPAAPGSSDDYVNLNYYDQALVQYLNFHRTGQVEFRDYARKIADSWWESAGIRGGTTGYESSHAPRNASLGGLIVRALDGRPEMWPWITDYTRGMFGMWVGTRVRNEELYYGIRDGGYALLFAAWLAGVHPDPAVRAEFRDASLIAARDYFARLQYPDGSWRWRSDPGNGEVPYEQPFMAGLLLEGMIAVHQLTGDEEVGRSILRSVDHLYSHAYRRAPERALWYRLYGTDCAPPTPAACASGEWGIPAERQNNPLVLHAFGYAYLLTGDRKYVEQGDEIFEATFGGRDGKRATVDYRPKEYSQGYRSSGRYLAWRMGR